MRALGMIGTLLIFSVVSCGTISSLSGDGCYLKVREIGYPPEHQKLSYVRDANEDLYRLFRIKDNIQDEYSEDLCGFSRGATLFDEVEDHYWDWIRGKVKTNGERMMPVLTYDEFSYYIGQAVWHSTPPDGYEGALAPVPMTEERAKRVEEYRKAQERQKWIDRLETREKWLRERMLEAKDYR